MTSQLQAQGQLEIAVPTLLDGGFIDHLHREDVVADAQQVAVAKALPRRLHHRRVAFAHWLALADLGAVDEGAVEAAQILDPDAVVVQFDQAVLARHRSVARQPQGATPRTPQDAVGWGGKTKLLALEVPGGGLQDENGVHGCCPPSSRSRSLGSPAPTLLKSHRPCREDDFCLDFFPEAVPVRSSSPTRSDF